MLSLPLLVLLIRADHPHHAAAADDLALVTHPFDRRSDLHIFLQETSSPGPPYTFARGDPDAPLRSRGSLAPLTRCSQVAAESYSVTTSRRSVRASGPAATTP